MAQGGNGHSRRTPSNAPGTDSRAQRYRNFSNVNQSFGINPKDDSALDRINSGIEFSEFEFAVKEGENHVSINLDRAPSGRIITIDSSGFQYDLYLRADKWGFLSLQDGVIKVRFI